MNSMEGKARFYRSGTMGSNAPALLSQESGLQSGMTGIAIVRHEFSLLNEPVSTPISESIYGAAMMAVIRSSLTRNQVVHGVTSCVFGGLVLNVIMQLYVLYCTRLYICVPAIKHIREIYSSYHEAVYYEGSFSQDAWEAFPEVEELCQIPLSQPPFFLAILICWTATIWKDLLESIRYITAWCALPDCSRLTVVENMDGTVVLKEANWKAKAFVLATTLIPKVFIALVLWWLGACWLAATNSFKDLLLNAVALAFVTELDELIYQVLVPEDIQAMVLSYRIARPHFSREYMLGADGDEDDLSSLRSQRDRRLLRRICVMMSTVTVVICLPIFYMRFLQQVLPGYRWDVHGPCEAQLQALLTL